jgi:hypothetical protein
MSVSSVGASHGPITPIGTETKVQRGKTEQSQQATGEPSNKTAKPTGAQPLNSSGRGQVINLIV